MLCELKVENLALIESLDLVFDKEEPADLVVMTGETGAGKSIMLRAIKMLTGERAKNDWIRSGTDTCVVEALFEVDQRHSQLLAALAASGFGDDTTIIIKRIITDKGRSRLYINGSLATGKVVRELTAGLINVASQHDHQQLLQPALHLDYLDTLGEHWPEREALQRCYVSYQQKKNELETLKKQEQEKEQKKDFLQFQFEEITAALLQPNEDEELEEEKRRLKSADSLIRLSQDSYHILQGEVLDKLSIIRKHMEQIVAQDGQAGKLAEDISGFCFMGDDLALRVREYRDSLESNPFRLEQVTERIDLLQQLKRKYGSTIDDILRFAAEAKAELEQLNNLEIQLSELEQTVVDEQTQLEKMASELHEKRKQTAAKLSAAIGEELNSLAFNNAALQVRWQENEENIHGIGPTGWDRVEFYFSANQGEPARPLAKVASGGELSRLMLAMKCLLAKRDLVDTVIFDEVDAGIGGEAAEAVARKIRELSTHHQVICITHLPQIAARGTIHFRVQKNVRAGRTVSSIMLLDDDERVEEVARMLAGDSATAQTHAWARELLEANRSR